MLPWSRGLLTYVGASSISTVDENLKQSASVAINPLITKYYMNQTIVIITEHGNLKLKQYEFLNFIWRKYINYLNEFVL